MNVFDTKTRIKREKPLLSMEQICEMNGIKYDTSCSSDHIEIINDDGESLKVDSSFNIFDDYMPTTK
ncbi:MAG: hypothetical protein NC485_14685 [Ruminococcus flavefaciens]|nr:hypothetical protein [Ruminococcus flavefaciens]